MSNTWQEPIYGPVKNIDFDSKHDKRMKRIWQYRITLALIIIFGALGLSFTNPLSWAWWCNRLFLIWAILIEVVNYAKVKFDEKDDE